MFRRFIALVCRLVAPLTGAVTFIGCPVPLSRGLIALVSGLVPLVGGALTVISGTVPLVCDGIAPITYAVALIGGLAACLFASALLDFDVVRATWIAGG